MQSSESILILTVNKLPESFLRLQLLKLRTVLFHILQISPKDAYIRTIISRLMESCITFLITYSFEIYFFVLLEEVIYLVVGLV